MLVLHKGQLPCLWIRAWLPFPILKDIGSKNDESIHRAYTELLKSHIYGTVHAHRTYLGLLSLFLIFSGVFGHLYLIIINFRSWFYQRNQIPPLCPLLTNLNHFWLHFDEKTTEKLKYYNSDVLRKNKTGYHDGRGGEVRWAFLK